MNRRRLKVCIVSEAIESPFDEGVKIFVYHFIKELAKAHEVIGIGRSARVDGEIERFCVGVIPRNRLLLSRKLRLTVRAFEPEILFYIPTACATLPSFVRAKILKRYGGGCMTVLISLQPRRYSKPVQRIIASVAPDLVLAQSSKSRDYLNPLGCRAETVPAGVDPHRFFPVTRVAKESLRKKHGVPVDKYVVLHVGPVNRNRNVQFMAEIQRVGGVQAVVVGSTSYPADSPLVGELREAGVIVIDRYLKEVEEIYQSADCYLFPVVSDGACIEFPLSVLEALACDLAVVSTRFGGLKDLIGEGGGLFYADTADGLKAKIAVAKAAFPEGRAGTRNLVDRFTWADITRRILEAAGHAADSKR